MRQDFCRTRLNTLQVRMRDPARNMKTSEVITLALFPVLKVRCSPFSAQAPPDVQSLENFAAWDWNSSAPFLCFASWPRCSFTLPLSTCCLPLMLHRQVGRWSILPQAYVDPHHDSSMPS